VAILNPFFNTSRAIPDKYTADIIFACEQESDAKNGATTFITKSISKKGAAILVIVLTEDALKHKKR